MQTGPLFRNSRNFWNTVFDVMNWKIYRQQNAYTATVCLPFQMFLKCFFESIKMSILH